MARRRRGEEDSPTACTWHGGDRTGLTHCLRAWFLRLKYRISFFRIAWFLGNTDRVRDGSSQQEPGVPSTGPWSEGSPLPSFRRAQLAPQSSRYALLMPSAPTRANLLHPHPAETQPRVPTNKAQPLSPLLPGQGLWPGDPALRAAKGIKGSPAQGRRPGSTEQAA